MDEQYIVLPLVIKYFEGIVRFHGWNAVPH